ncbi:hypothetical protein L7F22_050938 [Adiantum nelumboides]|nr:hypothetical protein [Adiantum nelumboides]
MQRRVKILPPWLNVMMDDIEDSQPRGKFKDKELEEKEEDADDVELDNEDEENGNYEWSLMEDEDMQEDKDGQEEQDAYYVELDREDEVTRNYKKTPMEEEDIQEAKDGHEEKCGDEEDGASKAKRPPHTQHHPPLPLGLEMDLSMYWWYHYSLFKEKNDFVEQQWLCHLRENSGYIMEEKDVSPKLVAEVFRVSHNPLHKLKKVTDVVMRSEFEQSEGSRAYYMVQNCGNFAVFTCSSIWIRAGPKGGLASFFFDRLQLAEPRDKRRLLFVTKVAPYLQAIFSHVLQVSLTPPPPSFVKILEVQGLSEAKAEGGDSIARGIGSDQCRYAKLAGTTQEFQLWVDGLKDATEKQFQEVEDKISHLTTDNNFLMNRLTPLVDLEVNLKKDMMDGQGVTRVLLADADVDALKREVFDYTKELWHQAAGIFQEHMAKPIDKYKSWFEAAGEYKVREENAELQARNADLEMQLEAITK